MPRLSSEDYDLENFELVDVPQIITSDSETDLEEPVRAFGRRHRPSYGGFVHGLTEDTDGTLDQRQRLHRGRRDCDDANDWSETADRGVLSSTDEDGVIASVEADHELRQSVHPQRKGNPLRPQRQGFSDSSVSSDSELISTEINDRAEFSCLLNKFICRSDIELLYPKSLWPHRAKGKEPTSEKVILNKLAYAGEVKMYSDDDWLGYKEVELTEFSIYRDIDHRQHPGKMECFHNVATEFKTSQFLLDGTAVLNGKKFYLEDMLIKCVSIGGYFDESIHTTCGNLWIKTVAASRAGDVWYKLQVPSAEYKHIWKTSVWLTDFVKHFLDFLEAAGDRNILLRDFAGSFIDQLTTWHGGYEPFVKWHKSCGKITDFRKHVARFAPFLKNQTWNLLELHEREGGSPTFGLFKHDLWGEIFPDFRLKDQESTIKKEESTIVTPQVGHCFTQSFPSWGTSDYNLLKIVDYCETMQQFREQRIKKYGLPNKVEVGQKPSFEHVAGEGLKSVAALTLERTAITGLKKVIRPLELKGKLIIARRSKGTNNAYQYGYVHTVGKSGSDVRVIWLLLPSHIRTIGQAFYPIGNELFVSDECNCEPVRTKDVYASFDISLHTDRAHEPAKFFAREKYVTEDAAFVTAKDSVLLCNCSFSSRPPIRRRQPFRDDSPPPNTENSFQKMRVLSLFSGCGLLDDGLEQSGHIETTVAIDIDKYAISSHAVNRENRNCQHIWGSVNTYLEDLLRGKIRSSPADCVVAGSPCKGFSKLNLHRKGGKGQRNCSLVAVTMSFVECFLPLSFLMENVPDIDGPESPNACEQIVAFLVALGYQVQKWKLDASEQGAPQRRLRMFLVATAPGFPFPSRPPPTHGHNKDLQSPVTLFEAVGCLDAIHNDLIANITNPDHIPLHRLKCDFAEVNHHSIVRKIPKQPSGMNLAKTLQQGLLKGREKDWARRQHRERLSTNSPCLQRVEPNKPFKTITTIISPLYGRGSPSLHWNEDRLLSLEEYRRGMGYPKSNVLIGPLTEQMKQMGNGVPFHLASAIGKQLAKSWRKYQWHMEQESKLNNSGFQVPSRNSGSHRWNDNIRFGEDNYNTTVEEIGVSFGKEAFHTPSKGRAMHQDDEEEMILLRNPRRTFRQPVQAAIKDWEESDAAAFPAQQGRSSLNSDGQLLFSLPSGTSVESIEDEQGRPKPTQSAKPEAVRNVARRPSKVDWRTSGSRDGNDMEKRRKKRKVDFSASRVTEATVDDDVVFLFERSVRASEP